MVEVGPHGEVYVVYERNAAYPGLEYGSDVLRLVRSADGGQTFSAPVDVQQREGIPVTSGTFHDVLVAPDGRVYVAWLDYREDVQKARGQDTPDHVEVRIAWSDDGGQTFGPSALVNGVSCECCRVSLARGRDGTLYLAWRGLAERPQGDDPIRDMQVARSADGGQTWDALTKVHDDNWAMSECPHSGPAMAIDSAGRLHVAWYTGKDSGPGVYSAVSGDGGRTFSAPITLLTDEWVPHSVVRLSVDRDDNAWVTWEDARNDPSVVQVARIGPRGEVSTAAGGFPGYTGDVVATAGAVVAWASDAGIRVVVAPPAGGGV